MFKEIFKEVEEFPGYTVSNLGRIKSPHSKKHLHHSKEHMTPVKNHHGYMMVTLSNNGRRKTRTLGRIVLQAFEPLLNGKRLDAAHLDGDKTNNRLDNLKWCTRKENESHKKLHGTYQIGENAGSAKLTEKEVVEISRRHIPYKVSSYRLAKEYGVARTTIQAVINRRNWAHVDGHP